jgi:hypothetical protein
MIWIKTADRMPVAEAESLLWCHIDDEIYIGHWSGPADDGSSVWCLSDCGFLELDNVTHWMTLPEPPQ